jgi:hypothetical protein
MTEPTDAQRQAMREQWVAQKQQQQQQQLPPPQAPPPQDRKHPPLKIIGIAAAVIVGLGVIGAVTNGDDDGPTRTKAEDEIHRLNVVWQTEPDIRRQLCETYESLGQYDTELGEIVGHLAELETVEAREHLQNLVEKNC